MGNFIKDGRGEENEPVNGTLISSIIAMVIIFIGDLNSVAQIITMFFLITYGSICLISFLEHFAGNPSYRPTFKAKWYISLLGAILCFGIMFQFSPFYALLTLAIMGLIHIWLGRKHKGSRSLVIIFQGVMFQLSRMMKIRLQKTRSKPDKYNWRPSVVAISSNGLQRRAPKEMLRWISYHHGFGTLVHFIKGDLSKKTILESKKVQKALIKEISKTDSNYTVNTVVSPSMLTLVAQTVQISGVSGMDNNTIMFEFNKDRKSELKNIMEGLKVADIVGYNKLVLRSIDNNFGQKCNINLWTIKEDFKNINLMILLSYIISEHKDWKKAQITIHTLFPTGEKTALAKKVRKLIRDGRLPISERSVRIHTYEKEKDIAGIIEKNSSLCDLTIIGFTQEQLMKQGAKIFNKYPTLKDVLFVQTSQDLVIT
jgi:hypothetical protein